MTHEEATKELTRIFREYHALVLVTRVDAATLPNVWSGATVLELVTRDDSCT